VEAALAIAIRRRETFLERTDEPPLDLDMRLLSTRIAGEFADLTVMALDLAQPARWEIGQLLLDAEASGQYSAGPSIPTRSFSPCLTRRCWSGACSKHITGSCGTAPLSRASTISAAGRRSSGKTCCPPTRDARPPESTERGTGFRAVRNREALIGDGDWDSLPRLRRACG